MSKFCDLDKNIKHIGEVSTSRVDGSPTGAEIDTSTNEVTGDVRDTLDGKLKKFDDQLLTQDNEFNDAKDAWDAQINSQYIYKNGGLWADAPSQITDTEKLTYWVFTDGNGYAVKGSVTLPIAKPASPVNDDDWFVAASINQVKQQVNNLHTKREAIEWRSGLRVTDELQLYVHDGVEYLPNINKIKLPFTTGLTFNSDNWSLSSKMVKMRAENDVRGWGAFLDGVNDDTDALTLSGGGVITGENVRVEKDIEHVFYCKNPVSVTGSGTIKILPSGTASIIEDPNYVSHRSSGELFINSEIAAVPLSDRAIDSIAGELVWYRAPTLTELNPSGKLMLTYQVLHYEKEDIGQTENTQSSGVKVKISDDFGVTWSDSISVFTPSSKGQEWLPSGALTKSDGDIVIYMSHSAGRHGIGHGSPGYTDCLQTYTSTSTDGGLTWVAPVDITDKVKPFNSTNFWLSPSPIIKFNKNQWIACCAWTNTLGSGAFEHGLVIITENKDGSLTYLRQHVANGNGLGTSNGAAEANITQLADGSLLYVLRDYVTGGGQHQVFKSTDGVSWVHLSTIAATSSTKGGVCVYSQKAWGDTKDLLVFSCSTAGDPNTGRLDVKLFYSFDNGLSWAEDASNYIAGLVGYSDAYRNHNGLLTVVSEADNYTQIKQRTVALSRYKVDKSLGRNENGLLAVDNFSLDELCRENAIPNYAMFTIKQTGDLGFNNNGTAAPLNIVRGEFSINQAWGNELDTSINDTFRFTVTPQNISVIKGKADKCVLVSQQGVAEITLTPNNDHPIPSERVLFGGSFSNKAVVLYPTSIGWCPVGI